MEGKYAMEENLENEKLSAEQPGKPTFFKVLLILSTINNGWSFLFGGLGSLMLADESNQDNFALLYIDMLRQLGAEEPEAAAKQFIEVGPGLLGFSAVIGLLALIGVFLMHRLQKLGFHIYVASQILSVFGAYYLFSTPGAGFPWTSMLLATMFVVWYRRFYGLMTA